MASPSVSSSTASSRTAVQPCRPHAPFSGANARGMSTHESILLLWREFDHAPLLIGVKRREDSTVGPEVGMSHMRPLNRVTHAQGDTPEVVGSQHVHALRRVSA